MAAKELLNRRIARRDLIAFTEATFPRYQTAAHHRRIATELEGVLKGECDRLMLLVMPRGGKSELASRRFPAFALGQRPDLQFISASATADLAADFGRDVRNIVASQEYACLFPDVALAGDSQAKGKWHTSADGIYYSVGVGGALMGRGANLALIDDPFASWEDADSELSRKRVWDWYTGTLYNRLMPGAAIVIIGHRMHEDDLQGRLLAQQASGGDQWRVVELPALSESGEALWEEWYDKEALERIRRNTPARQWSALFMQRPSPDDGTYFKAEHLREYTKAPDRLQIYGASDYAVTSDGGDYTVHVVVGVDTRGEMYVLDLWRGQTATDEWVEAFCDLVVKWKPIFWAKETGQILSAIGPYLRSRQIARKAWVAVEKFASKSDKSVRARSIQGRMSLMGLHLPAGEEWVAEFRRELLQFPVGKHDDQVDALGLIGQLLDKVTTPDEPKPAEKPRFGYGVVNGLIKSDLTFNQLRDLHKRAAGGW